MNIILWKKEFQAIKEINILKSQLLALMNILEN